jgi:hypothetical protein
MSRPRRIALGIRAQLLLVLTVFLAIPWLGYEYVRELERFLRDAQERTLAGTKECDGAHDRRDCSRPPRSRAILATEPRRRPARRSLRLSSHSATRGRTAITEIEQIIQACPAPPRASGSSTATSTLARAGSLKGARPPTPIPPDATLSRFWLWLDQLLHPLYALVLTQPTDDFNEEQGGRILLPAREIDGALAGILTVDRRFTPDGKAVIVSAAHPIWVGDQVRGAVIVEETTNTVLAERNRAFERLFSIVLATLLVGSVALTLFASRLSARILRRATRSAISRGVSRACSRGWRSMRATSRTWQAGFRTNCGRPSPWSGVRSTTCGCRRCRTRRGYTSSARSWDSIA